MRRALLSVLICMAGASPAFAFDCSKATRADEKAICADPALVALDARMVEAYKAGLAKLDAQGQEAMKLSQRVWLADRATCEGSAECLQWRIEQRIAQLDPKAPAGSGGPALVPWFASQPGAKNRWLILISGFNLAPPAKSLTLESYVQSMDAEAPRETIPAEDIIPDMAPYQHTRALVPTYLSDRFLAASDSTYEFSGGAHGNYGSTFLAIDLEKDEPADFYSIFQQGSESALIAECQRLLKKEREARNEGDAEGWDYKTIVIEKIGKLANWTFSGDSAAVYFAPYEAGSFAEGEYECRMPLSFLRPLLKPGNPWMPG